MRAFVTGATGFVGGHLTRRLRARGDHVRALVRRPADAGGLNELGVELIEGDLADHNALIRGMQSVDVVFHIAGWYKVGVNRPQQAYDVNVSGTRNVLRAMAETNVPKGVYTSTLAVNSDTGGQMVDERYQFRGEHLSVYDRTKWQAHHEVAAPMMADGLPLVVVMPGIIYGPGDHSISGEAIRSFLSGDFPPMLPQRAGACWAHVNDIVDGHLLAYERGRPGESYIIAGPAHTYVEVFELLSRLTGIPAPRLRLPPWMMRLNVPLLALLGRVVDLPPELQPEAVRLQAGVTYYGSYAKAEHELGYQPRDLETGMRQVLPFYK